MQPFIKPVLCIVCACVSITAILAQFTHTTRENFDSTTHDSIPVTVQPDRDTLQLNEAKILPFRDYSGFKQAFITLDIEPAEKDIAEENIAGMNRQIGAGITPEMDAQANFSNNYIQQLIKPQGLIFLSTEPGKGLPVVPLVKKLLGIKKKEKKAK